MTQNETPDPQARKSWRLAPLRRIGRLSAALLSGVLALVLVAGVALYARLSAGPIDLNAYLPVIAGKISERLPGARLDIEGAQIALTDDGGARVVVTDATLIDDETGPFAHVPEAKAAFRISDLMKGVLDPSNVILSGVEAKLVRSAEGAFQFGFAGEKGGGEEEGVAAFRRLFDAVSDGSSVGDTSETIPEARGQILQLANTRITYDDRLSGRVFSSSDAAIFVWNGEDGVYSNVSLTYDDGAGEPTRATFSGKRFEDGRIELLASLANASPRDMGDQIVALDWLSAFDVQVDAELTVAFTEAGDLLALNGSMRGGEGALRFGPEVVEAVTSTELTYAFEPETDRFLIERVAIQSDRLTITGAGFAQVNRDAEDVVSDVVAQFEFADIDLSAPEFLDAPLAYEEANFTGRLTLEPLTLEIGQVSLVQGPMRLNAAGRLWREEDDEWRADVTAHGEDFTLAEMLAHWPRQAAPGALVWMRENMSGARVIEADAFARLGGDDEDVKIDFTFENAEGAYLAPMPPIYGGVGAGQVDLQKFILSLDEGYVAVDDKGVIELAGSEFTVVDLNHPDSPAEVSIVATGPTAAALALIDKEPLVLTSKLGVPLGDVGGVATVKAEGAFPLLKDLLLEEVKISATAELTDVSLVAPGLGAPVSADTLFLEADTERFAVRGDARVFGLNASIDWREQFSPSSRTIALRTTVTPSTLETLGMEQAFFTDGGIGVNAMIAPNGSTVVFDVDANLTGAKIDVVDIGFTKSMGEDAAAKVKGVFADGVISLNGLSVETNSLIFDGDVTLTEEGDPIAVVARRLQYADAVDLAVDARQEEGRWIVDASGPLVDFSRFGDLGGEDGGGLELPGGEPRDAFPVRVNIDVDELRIDKDQYFRNVTGVAAQDRSGGVTVELDASLLEGGPVGLSYRRDPQDGGEVRVRSPDAGRLLRDLGVFEDGVGGDLLITGDIAPGSALMVDGRAVVRDLVIHDDAKLEQMLSGAELAELQQVMREDGISFSSIRAPFRFAGDRITLSDAVAKGSAIGVNISGAYELESEALDFDGVFTPLYSLNSALGKIPLLGDVLTGGDGQGVFAFNFAVRGNAKDPKVSVNPLSVLVPGILRNLVNGRQVDDDVAAAFDRDGFENPQR